MAEISHIGTSISSGQGAAIPSGISVGDMIFYVIVTVDGSDTADSTAPDGSWTKFITDFDYLANSGMSAWWKVATSSDTQGTTYTFGGYNTSEDGSMITVFRGVDPTTPIVDSATGTGGSNPLIVTDTQVVPEAGAIVYVAHNNDAGNATIGSGLFYTNSGFTTSVSMTALSSVDMGSNTNEGAVGYYLNPNTSDLTIYRGSTTATDVGFSSRFMFTLLPESVNATGNPTLLEDGEETIFTVAGSAGATGSPALLENADEVIFSPSGSADSPRFTPQERGTKTWTNKTI